MDWNENGGGDRAQCVLLRRETATSNEHGKGEENASLHKCAQLSWCALSLLRRNDDSYDPVIWGAGSSHGGVVGCRKWRELVQRLVRRKRVLNRSLN